MSFKYHQNIWAKFILSSFFFKETVIHFSFVVVVIFTPQVIRKRNWETENRKQKFEIEKTIFKKQNTNNNKIETSHQNGEYVFDWFERIKSLIFYYIDKRNSRQSCQNIMCKCTYWTIDFYCKSIVKTTDDFKSYRYLI